MAQKKKQPHIDKSPIRKRKAKTWIKTYTGADVVKDYRVHFKGVDVACAVRELQEISDIERNSKDFRPETYRPYLASLRIEQRPKIPDWDERRQIFFGTTKQYHNVSPDPFIIIGAFYPPMPSANRQMNIFD